MNQIETLSMLGYKNVIIPYRYFIMEKVKIVLDHIDKGEISVQHYKNVLKRTAATTRTSASNQQKALQTLTIKSSRWKNMPLEDYNIKINEQQYSELSFVQNKSNSQYMQQSKNNSSKQRTEKMRSKTKFEQPKIRNTIKNYRIINLTETFLNKLRKNSVYRDPISFQPFQDLELAQEHKIKLQINRQLITFYLILNIVISLFAIIFSTLLVIFHQNASLYSTVTYFSGLSILWCLFEMLIKLVKVYFRSSNISLFKFIVNLFHKQNLMTDIIVLIVHIISLCSSNSFPPYLYVLLLVRLPSCIENIKKLQLTLFDIPYWEYYWKLAKIILTNYFLAHFIAVVFILMAKNQQKSWITDKRLEFSLWYEQYIWAYYWATTTMLSVGFGDIAAANYKQAIILVLVQTLGCMTLAYNINCIGSILIHIKSKQQQKEKGLNFLRKFCNGHQIQSGLQTKLQNHIKQTFKIQTKYNFDQFDNFIVKLPQNLKQEFVREAHHKAMMAIPFIKSLSHKSIFSIAQKLILKVAHPQQIVWNSKVSLSLLILKQGQMGYCSSINSVKYSKIVIDKFIVNQNQTPTLLSLDFLKPQIIRKYDLKSLKYSIYCELPIQELQQILKNKDVDFELYYMEKNKFQPNSQQHQIIKCQFCEKKRHSKFQCPKLHYIPLSQMIVNRYLRSVKKSFSKRRQMIRRKYKISPFEYFKPSSTERTLQILNYIRSFDHTSGQWALHIDLKTQQSQSKQKAEVDLKHQQSYQLKTNLINNAAEVMKNEMKCYMQTIFLDKREFWNVEADDAHNYKFYFCDSNPQNLSDIQLKKPLYSKNRQTPNRRTANFTNYQAVAL